MQWPHSESPPEGFLEFQPPGPKPLFCSPLTNIVTECHRCDTRKVPACRSQISNVVRNVLAVMFTLFDVIFSLSAQHPRWQIYNLKVVWPGSSQSHPSFGGMFVVKAETYARGCTCGRHLV